MRSAFSALGVVGVKGGRTYGGSGGSLVGFSFWLPPSRCRDEATAIIILAEGRQEGAVSGGGPLDEEGTVEGVAVDPAPTRAFGPGLGHLRPARGAGLIDAVVVVLGQHGAAAHGFELPVAVALFDAGGSAG